MAKFDSKLKALKLRRRGMSINEIARSVGAAKSTVSIWCRDIKLTQTQRTRLTKRQIEAGHKGRMLGTLANRRKKEGDVARQEELAQVMVGKLSARDKLMLGIGLYWGEGVKNTSGGASIVNSDPQVILAARNWFEQLGVRRADLNPYIFISEIHRDREQTILNFWSRHLSIPVGQFHKVIFLKGRPKKVYENHDSYYGVLALRVRRSTSLKYRILGLIKQVQPG